MSSTRVYMWGVVGTKTGKSGRSCRPLDQLSAHDKTQIQEPKFVSDQWRSKRVMSPDYAPAFCYRRERWSGRSPTTAGK